MKFNIKTNLPLLKEFIIKTKDLKLNDKESAGNHSTELIYERLTRTREILFSMGQNPESWDDKCKFNLDAIGDQFFSTLRELKFFDPSKSITKYEDRLNLLYVWSFRFLCEYDFMLDSNSELSMQLSAVKTEVWHELNKGIEDPELSSRIIYALNVMPTAILKFYSQNKKINSFLNFDSKVEEATKLAEKLDHDINTKFQEEINAKFDQVRELEKKLDVAKDGFNFVGLYKGFSKLNRTKKIELRWHRFFLFIMSLVVLYPLYWQLSEIQSTNVDLIELVPLVSIELILLYFFRIILMNYRSSKTQLMQIELRQTMCQFIQSYTEYAAEMKQNDKVSLEKFENLIFSGILSDHQQLPTTFDGVSQIGDLVKSLKGSK